MVKEVTCRKEHTCVCCERKIEIGENASLYKMKTPTYDDNEKQCGIHFETFYMCKKSDCDEVGNKLEADYYRINQNEPVEAFK